MGVSTCFWVPEMLSVHNEIGVYHLCEVGEIFDAEDPAAVITDKSRKSRNHLAG